MSTKLRLPAAQAGAKPPRALPPFSALTAAAAALGVIRAPSLKARGQ